MTLKDALKVLHSIQDALAEDDWARAASILEKDFDAAVEAIELAEAQWSGLQKLSGVRL